jgi:hypothetical protein
MFSLVICLVFCICVTVPVFAQVLPGLNAPAPGMSSLMASAQGYCTATSPSLTSSYSNVQFGCNFGSSVRTLSSSAASTRITASSGVYKESYVAVWISNGSVNSNSHSGVMTTSSTSTSAGSVSSREAVLHETYWDSTVAQCAGTHYCYLF